MTAAAISLAAVATSASAAECPVSRARYADPTGTVTATFKAIGRRAGWPTDVAFSVQLRGRPKHWFVFDRGASRHLTLISTTDVDAKGWAPPSPDGGPRPLGDMTYLAATSSFASIPDLPTSGGSAPALIALPDLAELLARRTSPPENTDVAFLKLAGCRR